MGGAIKAVPMSGMGGQVGVGGDVMVESLEEGLLTHIRYQLCNVPTCGLFDVRN